MKNIVQLKNTSVTNTRASWLVAQLKNLKLDKVSDVHRAEDIVVDWLKENLSKGLSDFDVVALAAESLSENEGIGICREEDGIWRLSIKVGENRTGTISKKDVIKFAVEAYKQGAEKALEKY